jgi:plasmid maintenance system antidote protein VapI
VNKKGVIDMVLFRQVREKHNLSITEMAEKLGISKSYCSMLNSGERGISKDIALKLKIHFNISVEQSLYAQEVHTNKTDVKTANKTGTEG